MFLKGRQDKYRILLPDDIIPEEVNEKYSKILLRHHSFIYKPIDVVNESVKRIEVLGFNNGTLPQMQGRRGDPLFKPKRIQENNFMHSAAETPYRSPAGPISLIDKTLNIDFRHMSGFLNYFILFESFFYEYSRDMESKKLPDMIPIEIMNENGEVYARIKIYDPLVDGMDMLSLDFTQPVAQSQEFRVIFKYSNIDFEFIEDDFVTKEDVVEPTPGQNVENGL